MAVGNYFTSLLTLIGISSGCWRHFREVLLDSDRLGQVPGAVDVAAPEDCQVVGQQLHRDDGEDGLEGVDGVGNLDRLQDDFRISEHHTRT